MAGTMTCADGVGTYVDMEQGSGASVPELSMATGGAELGQLLALMGQRPPYKYSGLGEAGKAMTRAEPDSGRALAVALWVAVRSAGGVVSPADAGHAATWEVLAAAGRQAIEGMGEVACCVTLRTANEAQVTAAGLQLVGRNPFTAVGNAIIIRGAAEGRDRASSRGEGAECGCGRWGRHGGSAWFGGGAWHCPVNGSRCAAAGGDGPGNSADHHAAARAHGRGGGR